MSVKWTLASSVTAGDRLLNVGHAARQLSTGDTVMLLYDPAAANPNKVTLQLVTAASGHTATSLIATLSTDNFDASGVPQALAFEVDDDDNIYIVGADIFSGDTDQVGAQAFVKGSGLNWTPATYVHKDSSATEGGNLSGFAMAWSNTGGGQDGAGHLVVIANDSANGNTIAMTIDAGKLLNGMLSFSYSAKNPAFLGGQSIAAVAGSNLDISLDGEGGTAGLAAIAFDATHVTTGAFAVTGGGQLTTSGGLIDTRIAGAMSTATKIRVVWYAPGLFATIFRSSAHAGQLTINGYTSSAYQGTVESGTPSNFPAPSATLSWAVVAGPSSLSTLWLLGWSSATATTMLRLAITFNGAGAPSAGAVATDDTTVGTAGTTIRADPNPVDTLHADWQAYQSTSTYSLLGDFSSLNAAPFAPILLSPANAVIAVLAAGGSLIFQFSSPVIGDAQTQLALRDQPAGGAYRWWRISDSTWQAAETFNSTASGTVVFPSGAFVAGSVHSWTVRTIGSGASPQTGPYASAFTFTVANPAPATPLLTASYDPVQARTTLTLHSTDATGPTGSIEYSDDGGITWTFMRGSTALVINPGTATVFDPENPSQPITRQYRARSWTAAPQSPSLYATVSVAAPIAGYWITDPLTGTQMPVQIKDGSYHAQRKKNAAAHYPLGGTLAKIEVGDVFGREGTFTILTRSEAEDQALTALLNEAAVLLWKRPNIGNVYIFVTVDAAVDMTITPTSLTSYREHSVTFIETARP